MARIRLKTVRPDRRSCRKVTLLLSAETDLRLTVLAKARNVDRSALAEEVLAAHLRGVVVQVPA
jgi:predicted transcriptional regulator